MCPNHEDELQDQWVPTRELLRKKRKQAYEEQKAQRKVARQQAKVDARLERQNQRAKRDRELWEALKKAKDLPLESDVTSDEV